MTPDAPEPVEPPVRLELDENDRLSVLRGRVHGALLALPGEFAFENPISGVAATDLFNLNTLLGAGIEVEVVRTLNKLRAMWDPDDEWLGYRFERSAQVDEYERALAWLLRAIAADPNIPHCPSVVAAAATMAYVITGVEP